MKHYAATVQCKWCGHRFTVCFHSPKLVAGGVGSTVLCPENGSPVHIAAESLVAMQSCPVGAIIVREEPGRTRRGT